MGVYSYRQSPLPGFMPARGLGIQCIQYVVSLIQKPRPEAHKDRILFAVFLKNIPQDQIVQWDYLDYNINTCSAVVISVFVESSRCSSKTLKTGSCPYAPLDEALRYYYNCNYMYILYTCIGCTITNYVQTTLLKSQIIRVIGLLFSFFMCVHIRVTKI